MLGVIGICFVVISLILVQITTIKKIQTEGMNALITIDYSVFPNNLLFFPVERAKALLKAEYPFIADVHIEKKYPSVLKVILIPRIPIARLMTPERSLLVAQDGVILADTNSEEYPSISTSVQSLSVGVQITRSDIRNALAFLEQMPQDEDIQSIVIDNAGVLRVTLPASLVILSETRDGRESARTLQSVLTGFRIKGLIPKTIDLRFDQPVVTW